MSRSDALDNVPPDPALSSAYCPFCIGAMEGRELHGERIYRCPLCAWTYHYPTGAGAAKEAAHA